MSRNLKLSIKFLVSNNLAGSLIGPSGGSIKELIEITESKIHVSSSDNVYPGTSDRIVFISGSLNSVDLAQNLLWDMFAIDSLNSKSRETNKQKGISNAENPNMIPWSPKHAAENAGEYDTVPNKCKITIPATAAGAILGKGGSVLKSISENTGAELVMNNRNDSIFTQERILTISGTTSTCAKCVSAILEKLDNNLEDAQYVNNSTRYTTHLEHMIPSHTAGMSGTVGGSVRRVGAIGTGGAKRNGDKSESNQQALGDVITSTKITLTVPDNMIGNILGKKGSVMKEIMSLSGAKITISERTSTSATTENGETDTAAATTINENRIVTISGSPSATQTAHILITQKMQIAAQDRSFGNGERASSSTVSATSTGGNKRYTSGSRVVKGSSGSTTGSSTRNVESPAGHDDGDD